MCHVQSRHKAFAFHISRLVQSESFHTTNQRVRSSENCFRGNFTNICVCVCGRAHPSIHISHAHASPHNSVGIFPFCTTAAKTAPKFRLRHTSPINHQQRTGSIGGSGTPSILTGTHCVGTTRTPPRHLEENALFVLLKMYVTTFFNPAPLLVWYFLSRQISACLPCKRLLLHSARKFVQFYCATVLCGQMSFRN